MSSLKGQLILCVSLGLLAACAAKPPNVQPIPATADVSQELETTQRLLNEAQSNNIDVLSPKSFQRAQVKLNDARELLVRGKASDKILEDVAEARAWLSEAGAKAEVTRPAVKNVVDARSAAMKANAPVLYAKEFGKLDEEAREIAAAAEKGDLSKASKKGERVSKDYRDLEVQAITKNYVGEAQENLKLAKKAEADKNAPKTYGVTESKINYALSLIQENPRNMGAVARAGADAVDQSKFLLAVNQKTKEGNTEDLVLQSEKQKRVISGMAVGIAGAEAELAQKEAALKTAEELRSKLKPNEAEVYVEGNAVKVRLKGVQFGANQATINKKTASLLEKVDNALGTVGVSQVTVQGHTDSTGSPQANQEISLKRAQSVQDYLVSKGKLEQDQVSAVGKGSEDPISDNKTQKGRAENRRIDLLIKPDIEKGIE